MISSGLTRTRSAFVLMAGIGLAVAGCGASSSGSGATGSLTPAGGGSSAPTSGSTVTVQMADDSGFGHILETSTGSTLYLYTPDKPGTSVCTGGCAAVWPPLTVPAGGTVAAGAGVNATALSTITRSDGTKQVAVNGHPLYRFAADSSPGQTKGEGVEGTWFVVAPTGIAVKHISSTASNSTPTPTPTQSSASTGSSGGYGY